MSVGGVSTTVQEANRRFRTLLSEADRRGLYSPPPYSDDGKLAAWKDGYECALRDLSAGKLGGNFTP